MKKEVKCSVVVPVFNSEDSLEELYDCIRGVFEDRKESFEVVFVDDRSLDQSWEVLKKLKERHPDHITTITLSRNFGQHNATLCGLGFAKGEWVITIDDDLQIPPSEIPKLLTTAKETGAELIYGVYGKKMHSRLRNIGSYSLKKSARLFRNAPGEGSSFRLISSELIRKMLQHDRNFIFLEEVFQWYTGEIAFTEVIHLPRKYRRSSYSTAKLFRLMGEVLMYYTMVPLKVLVYGGFTLSLISFVIGTWFIIKKIFFDVPLGFTALIVTILFSTSIILFSLGVLGEYLSRIYQAQNHKPPYSIRKIL
jgi:undecaprenyl-phosphate 4-deoxy-4-formamido-L-arabinose transferase